MIISKTLKRPYIIRSSFKKLKFKSFIKKTEVIDNTKLERTQISTKSYHQFELLFFINFLISQKIEIKLNKPKTPFQNSTLIDFLFFIWQQFVFRYKRKQSHNYSSLNLILINHIILSDLDFFIFSFSLAYSSSSFRKG